MNTIVINIDAAALDLATVTRRLRESGDCALLMDANVVVAEIRPIPLATVAADLGPLAELPWEDAAPGGTESRVVRSKLTGLSVVPRRPGERMVTSEEIYEMLRGSFP
jgi:hypothetical protein